MLGGKCRGLQGADRDPLSGGRTADGGRFCYCVLANGLTVFLPVALIFAAVMISLMFIDAEHMILPNVITYPLLVFAILVRLVYPIAFGTTISAI